MFLPRGLRSGINYFKEQIRAILTSFPPFFPAGSPQRIDLIKKVKGLEELVEKSSPKKSSDKTSSDNRLSEDASDKEISAALGQTFRLQRCCATGESSAC